MDCILSRFKHYRGGRDGFISLGLLSSGTKIRLFHLSSALDIAVARLFSISRGWREGDL